MNAAKTQDNLYILALLFRGLRMEAFLQNPASELLNPANSHKELDDPAFFEPLLKPLASENGMLDVGLILVPQEGKNAGKPRRYRVGDPMAPLEKFEERLLQELEQAQNADISELSTDFLLIEPIDGAFGNPIGYLWAKARPDANTVFLSEAAIFIANTVENSKKSRLHEVVSRDFIANRDIPTLLTSVADTVKNGLYCEEVIVWSKEGNLFRSYGLEGWDLLANNSMVKRAYDGETIEVSDLESTAEPIYYKDELKELGINSFFLVPAYSNETSEVICIVGVLYRRKGGTTKVDLELAQYVVAYFEKLWTLYDQNQKNDRKLQFFDDILDFHSESIDCMVSFHEIKSIFQVLDSQIASARAFTSDKSEAIAHLKIAKNKVDRGLYLLEEYAATFATAGAIDDELTIPNDDDNRVKKVDLEEYLRFYLSSYEKRCEESGILLRYTTSNLPKKVRLNLEHFELIIDNYMTNAIYALQSKTHTKKEIKVSVELADGWLKVEVSDNGSGIEPTLLRHVFTANVTTRKAQGGRGLGLALVWKVGLRYGRLPIVTSKWGYGATFTSWLKPVDTSG